MQRITILHVTGARAPVREAFPAGEVVELVLGRDPEAAVRFHPTLDRLVGRRHALITRASADGTEGGFTLHDLDARNGTFLNRCRVLGSAPLRPGDTIQLGAGGPEVVFDLVPRRRDAVARVAAP